jgi:signal transduction histidine kinase
MDSAIDSSFERFAAARLREEREQITRDWIERLSRQLDLALQQVLPHADLLDDMPLVLEKAAEFLLIPEPQRLVGEQLIVEEMRNIALLRHRQGWGMQEVVREFDELAQVLDGAALRWIEDYPGTPEAASVGRVFGRLNRVPLLMGQIMVGTLETERNRLLNQLSAAAEEERSHLSRELHDHLGQLVTALILGLKTLEPSASSDQAAAIDELRRTADRIAREAQHLAVNLRPPALDTLGLGRALEAQVSEWAERTGIECDFHSAVPDRERCSPEVETALYRVTQEGLNNVVKHSGANRISLILERRDAFITMILEDNGKGFDVEPTLASPEKAKRLGLRGMRERIALLGGTVEIESSLDNGTTLFVRVPDGAAPAWKSTRESVAIGLDNVG